MARFLIEVPHERDEIACAQVAKIYLSTGSHFLANADWGCYDGEHKAWIIVDADSKEEARSVLPSAFHYQAKIVKLKRFTIEEIDEVLSHHRGKSRIEIREDEMYDVPC